MFILLILVLNTKKPFAVYLNLTNICLLQLYQKVDAEKKQAQLDAAKKKYGVEGLAK